MNYAIGPDVNFFFLFPSSNSDRSAVPNGLVWCAASFLSSYYAPEHYFVLVLCGQEMVRQQAWEGGNDIGPYQYHQYRHHNPPPPNIHRFPSLRTLTDRLAHRAEGSEDSLTFLAFWPRLNLPRTWPGKMTGERISLMLCSCYPQRNYLQFAKTIIRKAGESVRCAFWEHRSGGGCVRTYVCVVFVCKSR